MKFLKNLKFKTKFEGFCKAHMYINEPIVNTMKFISIIDFFIFRDPEPDQKLQDLVNKTMWKKCCFSGDGEYVCAGSARQHALYIWEKATGTLMKILHGTKGEILLDVVVSCS